MAPYYKASFDITPLQLSLMFAWFGAFGFAGNLWVSQHIDRLGPPRAVMLRSAAWRPASPCGGWLIARDQMSMLHWAGLASLALAILTSWLASRAAQHPGPDMPRS